MPNQQQKEALANLDSAYQSSWRDRPLWFDLVYHVSAAIVHALLSISTAIDDHQYRGGY